MSLQSIQSLIDRGEYQEALNEIKNLHLKSNNLYQLLAVRIYRETGEFEKAGELLESLENTPQDLLTFKIQTLVEKAYLLWRIGNIHKAEETIKFIDSKLIEAEESSGPDFEKILLQNVKGNIAWSKGNLDQAKAHYDFVRDELKGSRGTIYSGHAVHNTGVILWSKGQYRQALQYYEKALEIFEFFKNKRAIGRAINNMGIIHRNLGDMKIALDHFLRALKLREEVGNHLDIAETLNNIDLVKRNKGDIEAAVVYLNRSIEVIGNLQNHPTAGITHRNLGGVYFDNGEFDLAINS